MVNEYMIDPAIRNVRDLFVIYQTKRVSDIEIVNKYVIYPAIRNLSGLFVIDQTKKSISDIEKCYRDVKYIL